MSGVKGVWCKMRLVSKVSGVNVSCVKDVGVKGVWCNMRLVSKVSGVNVSCVKEVWCQRCLV